MWIDTNDCDQSWHEIKRDDKGLWNAYHNDESECDDTEFNVHGIGQMIIDADNRGE